MLIVDTGFLYALADGRDRWHARAAEWAPSVDEGWITTWPVVTETCHLLAARLEPSFAADVIDDVHAGVMSLWEPERALWPRAAQLMRKYQALPMDLADATLVLLAEHLGHGRILSTDVRDFETYRWSRNKRFENLLRSSR
jgi:uncharacterized protein